MPQSPLLPTTASLTSGEVSERLRRGCRNAPWFAVKGWNLIKPLLPLATQAKVNILGSGDFLPVLDEYGKYTGIHHHHSRQVFSLFLSEGCF